MSRMVIVLQTFYEQCIHFVHYNKLDLTVASFTKYTSLDTRYVVINSKNYV